MLRQDNEPDNCGLTQFSGKVVVASRLYGGPTQPPPLLQSNSSQCDIKRFHLGENFNKNFGGLYAAVALKKQEHENC